MKVRISYLVICCLLLVNMSIAQWSGSSTPLDAIYRDGNVGIGVTNPGAKLHVNGAAWITNGILELESPVLGFNTGDRSRLLRLKNNVGNASFVDFYSYRFNNGTNWTTATSRIQQTIDVSPMGFIEFNPPNLRHGMSLGCINTSHLYISEDGKVGVGTFQFGSFKLAVEGVIGARGIKVTTAPFPDYVFDSAYNRMDLDSLEKYISQYKHLPGIPSAAEVEKDGGIELGEMNRKMLEKIEELTLYIIDLKKENERMKKENEQMKEEIKTLTGK